MHLLFKQKNGINFGDKILNLFSHLCFINKNFETIFLYTKFKQKNLMMKSKNNLFSQHELKIRHFSFLHKAEYNQKDKKNVA